MSIPFVNSSASGTASPGILLFSRYFIQRVTTRSMRCLNGEWAIASARWRMAQFGAAVSGVLLEAKDGSHHAAHGFQIAGGKRALIQQPESQPRLKGLEHLRADADQIT